MAEVIFEFVKQGAYVKVTAIDVNSGIEATMVGDAAAGQKRLEQLALQKLHYVMSKRKG